MDTVTVTLPQDMTTAQIGARYTIGGAAYGPAIAKVNSLDNIYGPNDYLPAGAEIQIPVEWIGANYVPESSAWKAAMPLIALALIAVGVMAGKG